MLNFITTNKIAVCVMLVFLVSIFGYLPIGNIHFRVGRTMIAEWAMMIFIAHFFINNKFIKLFIMWSVASLIIHGFWTGYFDKDSYIVLNTLFLASLFYQVIKNNIRKKHITFIINGLCVMSIIQSLLMHVHAMQIPFIFYPKLDVMPAVGFLDNTNLAGAFLAITIPLFFRKYWCIGLVSLIPAMIESKSMGGVLSLAIASIVFLFIHTKKIKTIAVYLSVIICFVYLYCVHFEDSGRFSLNQARSYTWSMAVKDFMVKRPVVGYGIGQWKSVYKSLAKHSAKKYGYNIEEVLNVYAHNEYVQVFLEMGTVGLVIVLSFIGFIIFRYFLSVKTETSIILFCCLMACFANAFVNFLFHITSGLITVVYFALFEKETESEFSPCLIS